MYSLGGYGSMIADRVRIEAYAHALRGAIRPESTVLEIGTGPGIFAVLACQLGAGRVYAIEPDDVIQVARDVARANGFEDRIEFFQDISTKVSLPIKADVIVSDLRGVLPLFGKHLPAIADARRRLLAPGGILIPRKDLIWASIAEAPETYGGIVDCWERNALDIPLAAARQLAVNNSQKARLKPEQMLAQPRLWATLDYTTIEDPNVRARINWTVERAGTGHGLLVWFDTELAENIGFSNAPGAPEAIYGSLFFPWAAPVPLEKGQGVCVDIAGRLVGDEYVWRWTTEIASPNSPSEILHRFDQSQLAGAVISPEKLHRKASDYIPQLSEDGRLRRRTLDLMDGKSSLDEIARRLASEFPEKFESWQQALSYAGNCSSEYSR